MGQRAGARLAGLNHPGPPPAPPGLAAKRARARAALWVEQLWPAAWPSLGLLGAFAIFALLDGPAWLPAWPRLLLPFLVLLGALVLIWRGARRINRPVPDSVDRRLERASGLRHRPLAALQDRPASATPEAAAIWEVHQARLATQLRRLRVGPLRPGLPARDRRALRGLVLIGLFAALVIAGIEAPNRLLAAIAPGLPQGPAAPGTVVQAWVTPPAYTGLPPVFLQPNAPAPPIPAGARLTASVTGGRGAPTLAVGEDGTGFTALDAASWQADRALDASGHLVIRRGGQQLAGWALTIIPDRPPTAAFTDPPGAATSSGRPTTQSRFAWHAEDDYGVTGATIELHLKDRPEAPPLVIPAPPGGNPKQVRGVLVQDLTAHPWAGLPVQARVVAKDAIGQTGASAEAAFDLPERAFANPVAQAVIAIRKQLSLTPELRQDARTALDALADDPGLFDNSAGVLLQLRAAGFLLGRGRGQPAVDEAQSRLWDLALTLEEGAADRTAKALEAARQAARDAMDAARQDPQNEARRAELERRLEELRQAIQKHIDALTEQARRENTELPLDPGTPQMNARDLDRMAQKLEEAAREGRMDDARQQMAELERLLEQLQNARPEHGEQREKRNAERRQQGRQQQDVVQDMVRREGDLLDRSRGRAEGATPQPPAPSPGQPPQAATRATPEQRAQDQRRQAAMRRALGELMQRFGDLTGQVPAPLGEADTAMREAGQAMGEGRDAAATAAQQRAIEALQKGGREMGQQMARQFGPGQQPGEGEEGEGDGQDGPDGPGEQGMNPGGDRNGQTTGPQPGEPQGPSRRRTTRRDPLGRPMQPGTSGTEESGDVRVPDQMEEARTRALQEELRRRGADRGRPQPELDYIDRLLKTY